jgi:hypothetical protein
VEDSGKAAAILAKHAHPKTAIAYENLAWGRLATGDFPGAGDASSHALAWSQRVSYSRYLGMSEAMHASARYHLGDWQAARSLSTDHIDDDSRMTVAWAAWTRGRIALAEGEPSVALRDGEMIVAYCTDSGDDEELLFGLALLALAHHARREPQEAAARERFFTHWHDVGSAPGAAPAAAELGRIHGHETGLRHLANSLPVVSPWHQALSAMAEGRPADAADIYREMGSRPLEAGARLVAAEDCAHRDQPAEAAHQAQQALSFYERVGATRYAEQARSLLDGLSIRPARSESGLE